MKHTPPGSKDAGRSAWKSATAALLTLFALVGLTAAIKARAADGRGRKASQTHQEHAGHADHDEHAEKAQADKGHGDHDEHAEEAQADKGHADHDDHADHDEHAEKPAADKGHADDDDHADHDEHAEEAAADKGHADDGEHAEKPEADKGHADHDEHAEKPEAHKGHDHDEHAEKAEAHKGHAGHDDHGEEGLTLSPEEFRNAGIVIAKAESGRLRSEIIMPGEVSLNEDRVVHVVPLVGGITREVRSTVGDEVEAGQVLAVLESSALGEAKLDYLTKVNEILCCNILAPRAQAVHDNTLRLLAFLDGKPPLGDLQTFKAGEAGENLTTLIGAYAQMTSARQTYEREKGLYGKKISSEQDYLVAKAEYEKAVAEYMASRDSIAFAVKRDLLEVQAELRSAKFGARTSEQRLRLMGIGAKEIHALDGLVFPEEECSDPNCKGCKTGASAEEREHYFGNGFARYEIRSPDSGIVVEKHIVRGEKVGDEAEVFTVADTRTVWVNLTVYLKDLSAIRVGAEVTVRAEHSGRATRGRITMVSPIVSAETRTATARVVLENDDGSWRPGIFVVGHVKTSAEEAPVVLPKGAVQTVEGKQVVFVPEGEVYEPTPVRTGRSDRERVEITAGLAPGTPYVAQGAFELKAKLVTSSLGSHAGHGH